MGVDQGLTHGHHPRNRGPDRTHRGVPRRLRRAATRAAYRSDLKDWLDAAEAEGGHAYGLACRLTINGLRVGEACGTNVDDLAADRWHHTLTIRGTGDKPAVVPLLLTRVGTRMNRPAAARVVARLTRAIGCSRHITPHSLRHSPITAA